MDNQPSEVRRFVAEATRKLDQDEARRGAGARHKARNRARNKAARAARRQNRDQ